MHLSPGTVWLDTARPDAENRRSLFFVSPRELLVAEAPGEVAPLLEKAQRAREAGRWVAGFLSYEAASAWLPVRAESPRVPLVWLGVYDAPTPPPTLAPDGSRLVGLRAGRTAEAHAKGVEAIRGLIREGDVYQVNYTMLLEGRLEGTPGGLYAALREKQPVPYGACIVAEWGGVVSLSPELFFRTEGRRISTRPMKGTAPRGATPEQDARIARWLHADAKNRAENLMIVDLLRNDLSRVSLPGSVEVRDLFATEHHPTVHQMTSTVAATLREDVELPQILEALFPSGSITGAPKHRAMQRIAELESVPRGVYCGAIGYAAPHAEMAFSVPIRTVEIHDGMARVGVGSGVVWDSDPVAEYEEALLKARFVTDLYGTP